MLRRVACSAPAPPLLISRLLSQTCTLQGETVVQQRLEVDGKVWLMTCVSMGNPHAMTFGLADGTGIKVGGRVGGGGRA